MLRSKEAKAAAQKSAQPLTDEWLAAKLDGMDAKTMVKGLPHVQSTPSVMDLVAGLDKLQPLSDSWLAAKLGKNEAVARSAEWPLSDAWLVSKLAKEAEKREGA